MHKVAAISMAISWIATKAVLPAARARAAKFIRGISLTSFPRPRPAFHPLPYVVQAQKAGREPGNKTNRNSACLHIIAKKRSPSKLRGHAFYICSCYVHRRPQRVQRVRVPTVQILFAKNCRIWGLKMASEAIS